MNKGADLPAACEEEGRDIYYFITFDAFYLWLSVPYEGKSAIKSVMLTYIEEEAEQR